jgi:hypothetical protein
MMGAVFIISLLFGCSAIQEVMDFGRSAVRELTIDERKETENVAQLIISALDTKDEDALRSVLSQKALGEATDLDEGIAYIMSLYRGSSVQFKTYGNVYNDYYGEPGRTKWAQGRYEIQTEYGDYILYFELWLIDEHKPENLGVYRMRLMTKEDDDEGIRKKLEAQANGEDVTEWRYGAGYERPGIYHPAWETEDEPDSQ